MEKFHIFLKALKNELRLQGVTYPTELAGVLQPVGGCDKQQRSIFRLSAVSFFSEPDFTIEKDYLR